MRRFVFGCLSAGWALLTLATAPAPASAELCALPAWAASALLSGEGVVDCSGCGGDCFRVFVAADGDSLAGHVVRLVKDDKDIARQVEAGWLRSDAAGPGRILEFEPGLLPADALTAVQAARPQLRFGEQVLEVAPAAAPQARPGGAAVDTEAHVVAVTLGRPGQPGRRELRVHVDPDGAFVETQGIRTH